MERLHTRAAQQKETILKLKEENADVQRLRVSIHPYLNMLKHVNLATCSLYCKLLYCSLILGKKIPIIIHSFTCRLRIANWRRE